MSGDVRALARECLVIDNERMILCMDARRALIFVRDDVRFQTSFTIGALRHAVEAECERRGLGSEWHAYATGGYAFSTKGYQAYLEIEVAHPTALGCAILALKWLLENPVEEDNG